MQLVKDDSEWNSWDGIAQIRARCEAQAQSEGLDGLELIFRKQELFNECLANKSSYKERQAKWAARQVSKPDPLRAALQAIADGHNDPRSLAIEVLSSLER